jgi:PPOX class probable F420-dependent enzyme
MPSGSSERFSELPRQALAVVEESRRAVLTTIDTRQRPHAVPICFAIRGDEIVTAVDAKPKRSSNLARIRNLRSNPTATVLFDRWSEDWARLGWVMVKGVARLDPPRSATELLAARYEQYRRDPPEGDVVVIVAGRLSWWTYS